MHNKAATRSLNPEAINQRTPNVDRRSVAINVKIQRDTWRLSQLDEFMGFGSDLWRLRCGILSEISDCGHDVRRGRQSSRRSGYRLQMEQRHVCVNVTEQLTDTGEPIMTTCWLTACRTCSLPRSILSIRWSPLWRSSSRFNSNCVILSCVRRAASVQSVGRCFCLNHWLCVTPLFTSMSLTCRALSSLTVAFVSASPSRSWSFFSSAFSLSAASSRSLWHRCSSSSCCDSYNKTQQHSRQTTQAYYQCHRARYSWTRTPSQSRLGQVINKVRSRIC